jgi:hypothetical protein
MASIMTLSKAKKNIDTIKGRYTSRLQKGGALLDDMRLLVRSWSNDISWDKQRQKMILENILGKKTRSRTFDVYQELFVPRFLKGDPPEAWKIIRPLEDREFPLEILKPLYYWITARSEPLLYDFVVDEIFARRKGIDLSVWIEETSAWIKKQISLRKQSWSDAVIIRVARGLLAALRDFGILEGAARKKIAPLYLPVEAFAYIAFVLFQLGSTGEKLVVHPNWKLFLLQSPVVERLFLEAHQSRLLRYEAAGKIYRIEFYAHNMEDMANVVARRQP